MVNLQALIAADHAGFELKQQLIKERPDIQWIDLGTSSATSVDYPHFADLLAQKVIKDKIFGVLICGSGIGMSIRANRFSGVRAALCMNQTMAQLAREHNDANVLCLGSRLVNLPIALEMVDVFLRTAFAGGRHQARVNQLDFPAKI